tara:strand:- start:468 stop:593 length:126 start_codon:yes stop_codon:yes gene_type:complete
MVLATPDVSTGVKASPALTHDDVTGANHLSAEHFDAKAFGF